MKLWARLQSRLASLPRMMGPAWLLRQPSVPLHNRMGPPDLDGNKRTASTRNGVAPLQRNWLRVRATFLGGVGGGWFDYLKTVPNAGLLSVTVTGICPEVFGIDTGHTRCKPRPPCR